MLRWTILEASVSNKWRNIGGCSNNNFNVVWKLQVDSKRLVDVNAVLDNIEG